MTELQAAYQYANALRNFVETIGLDADDKEALRESVSVHPSYELTDRYGDAPKVILDLGSVDLHGQELRTDFGWVDLADHGLKPEELDGFLFEPYHAGCVCVHPA